MKKFKIAFIGAGSIGFTRGLLKDILSVPELQNIEVAFMDINQRNLDMVYQLCQRDIEANGLDIKIHAMMLESIFFPNSPLHDGAVIIRDDRIVAARVILPLTRAENISRRLGTRHRAALGISEETDAITIIVSEETGAISVAYRGALHRDLSGAELTSCLEKLVMSHQDDDDLAETVRMFEDQPTLGPVQTPVPEQKIKEEKE